MPSPTIRTLLRSAVEDLWSTGDLDLADQCFAPTYVDHGGLVPDILPGPESVKLAVVVARLAFPGLLVAIDDLIVEGCLAEVRWTAIAVPKVNKHGATGPKPGARICGVTLARFATGQIVESWTRFDAKRAAVPVDSFSGFAA